MDEDTTPPEKPAVPPPNIPKPNIPPVKPHQAPPVKVKIREAGSGAPEVVDPRAPFNTRILAALIDVLVAAGVQMAALWVLPGFASKLAWLLGFAYLVTRDSLPFLGGQSVGKKAMKLRAVTDDDQALTGNWEKALIRNGVLLIPFFAFVELVVLLTREEKVERGKRLGDEWAKTKVVLEAAPEEEGDEEAV